MGSGSFVVPTTGCGVVVTAVFPTDFGAGASTTNTGTYTATFSGTTSTGASFYLINSFTVHAFAPPVPEFPTPAIVMAGVALALLMLLRKSSVLKTN